MTRKSQQSHDRRTAKWAVLASLVLLLAVMFSSPLQTASARWLGQSTFGAQFQLDSLWVLPWQAQISGLQIAMPGFDLAARNVRLELSLPASMFGLRLHISNLQITGLRFEYYPDQLPPAEPEANPPSPFDGLAGYLKLPGWLAADQIGVNGTFGVHPAGEVFYQGSIELESNTLQAGKQPDLDVQAAVNIHRQGQQLASMTLQGLATGQLADNGVIAAAEIELRASPTSGRMAEEFLLSNITLAVDDAQEALSLIVEGTKEKRLVEASATFITATRVFDLDWTVHAPTGVIESFMRGDVKADIAGKSSGNGRIDLDGELMRWSSVTRLQGDGWGAFDSRLARWGKLTFRSDVRAEGWGNEWLAQQLDIALQTENERQVLLVESLQETRFDLADWTLRPQRWDEPALRIALNQLPLTWLRDFDPAKVFEGGDLSGTLELVPVAEGHIRLDTEKPLHASSIKLRAGDRGPLPELDIEVIPHARIEQGQLVASIERLLVRSSRGLDLRFEGRALSSVEDWPVIDFEGGVSLRAPLLQDNIRDLDAVRGVAAARLDLDRMVLGISSVGLDARSTNETTYASLELKGDAPLELGLPDWAPDWDNYEPQRAILRLNGLPVEWLGLYMPEIELRNGVAYGELRAVSSTQKTFRLEAPRPFELRNIEPYYRGLALTRSVTAQLTPRAALRTDGGEFAIENIVLRSLTGDQLEGEIALRWRRDDAERITMSLLFDGDFPSINQHIGELGVLHWFQQGSINRLNGKTEIDEFKLSFGNVEGDSVVDVTALRPFSMAGNPLMFAAGSGAGHILQARIRPLELERLMPDLGGLNLQGLLPEGEFHADIDGLGRLVVASEEPLLFRDVKVLWDEATLFEGLAIGLDYEVAYSASGLEARSVSLHAETPDGASLGNFSVRAVAPLSDKKMLQSLDAQLQLQLPPMASQPIMDGLKPLQSGSFEGTFSLINGQRQLVQARLGLNGTVVQDQGALPDIAINLDAKGQRGRDIDLHLPLRMESAAGSSDLELSGAARRDGELITFETKLGGERLRVEDLQKFFDYLMPARIVEEPTAPENEQDAETGRALSRTALQQLRAQRDTVPFWTDRLSGVAKLDISNMEFPGYSVRDIGGSLQVSETDLQLVDVEASMLDARLASFGTINFDAKAELPYAMDFNFELQDLQIGELLSDSEKLRPPIVEGLFSLETGLQAHGRNALDLGLASQGEIRLTGRDGVFRGLAGQGGAASVAAGVVGTLTFSRELKSIGRILDQLEELPFSELNVLLVRPTPQRLELQDLLVVSPQLRLRGAGEVTIHDHGPLVDSALNAGIDMATRQDMTILFDGMGLLEEQPDAEGYQALIHPLHFGGTLAEPDTSSLWQMLDEAAENSKGLFGFGLRRINRKLQKQQAQDN